MRAALALFALTLSACDQSPTTPTRELASAGDANARAALERIEALKDRVEQLEQDKLRLEGEVIQIQRDLATVSEQTEQNARAANNNAVDDMTRRGVCGTEVVQVNGGYVTRNRRCTHADLAR